MAIGIIETISGGIVIALFSGGAGALFAGKGKASKDEVNKNIKQHAEHCPENREVLTKPMHDDLCKRSLSPIKENIAETKTSIKELHVKIDKVLTQQTETVKLRDLQRLISVGTGGQL